jgi:rhamnosyltransferase subunit B
MSSAKVVRFLFNPSGTAGDIHPYVAVGVELQKRGHEVYLLCNELFEHIVEEHGLNFVAIGERLNWDQIRDNQRIHKPLSSWREAIRYTALGTMEATFTAIQKLSEDRRTVLAAPAWSFGARVANEALKIPLATFVLNPFILRSTVSPPVTPGMFMPPWMPRWMKLEQYWFADTFLVEPLIGKEVNAFRAKFGLARVRRYMNQWWFSPDLVLGLFYDFFVPPQVDWPRLVQFVGHPLWDPSGTPTINEEVQRFVRAGDAPICFVPGSVGPGSYAYFSVASEACRQLKKRGLILDKASPESVGSLPRHMMLAAYSPLSEVLPHCSALVHSGCMGTLSQAMVAGIPHVVRPTVNDQPDNARRIDRLGIGKQLSVRQFSTENLVSSLRFVLQDQNTQVRCRTIRQQIHAQPAAIPFIADKLEELSQA